MLTIWSSISAICICKNNELGCKSFQGKRNQSGSVPRRLPDSAPQPHYSFSSNQFGTRTIGRYGLAGKLTKIGASSLPSNRVPRDTMEYPVEPKTITKPQGSEKHPLDRGFVEEPVVDLVVVKSSSRKSQLRELRSPAWTTSLSSNTKRSQSPSEITKAQEISDSTKCNPRVALVASKYSTAVPHPPEECHSFCNHRRCRKRLGSHYQQLETGRPLEQTANVMAQQSQRTLGRSGNLTTTRSPNEKSNGHDSVRQQIGSGVYHERRGHEIPETFGNYRKNISFVQTVSNQPSSPVHTRTVQFNSGHSIESVSSTRVDAKRVSSSVSVPEMGHSVGRPFCKCPISDRKQLRERGCQGLQLPIRGCFQPPVEVSAGLDLSSPRTHSTRSATPREVQRNLSSCNPKMGTTLLENRDQATSVRPTYENPEPTGESNRSNDRTPPSRDKGPVFAGLEGTGWSRLVQSLPAQSRELLESSWRKSTMKTYTSAWIRWKQWALCNNCKIDNPEPHQIANYINYLHYKVKLAAKTIAVHKSVVTTFANPERSEELCNHPIVKRMMKAVFAARPPVKRPGTWNVSDLINYLKSYPIDDNNLFQVSRHVAALLLLASGRRIHDLTLLDISPEALEFHDNHVILWPKFGSKTDNSKFRQSGWQLNYIDDERLNLVSWIRKLISVSRLRRDNLPNLFITTRGKLKGASRCIIAGWIRTLFKDAKISGTPGSCRAAVNSDNWINRNIDLDEVIKRGNWRSKDTFLKYYFKIIPNPHNSHANTNYLNLSFTPI